CGVPRGPHHRDRRLALRPCRCDVLEGQVERERAALARLALEADLSAEQLGEVAADAQAEAGAVVLAAGGAVGLLKSLEDDLVLLTRNADAGVDDRELDDRA